jgi:hypothetical protein
MNRTIKFRVWNKKSKRFGEISLHTGFSASGFFTFEDDENVCIQQFTGLTDSQDNEIYEGDILRDKGDFLYMVFWHEAASRFELTERSEAPDGYLTPKFGWRDVSSLSVVGNKFENPELLEKQ